MKKLSEKIKKDIEILKKEQIENIKEYGKDSLGFAITDTLLKWKKKNLKKIEQLEKQNEEMLKRLIICESNLQEILKYDYSQGIELIESITEKKWEDII